MTTSKLNNNTIMKAQSITTLFLVALLVAACGPQEEGLDAKKTQLTEARAQLLELNAQISQLEKEIEAEDPEYFKSKTAAILVTSLAANTTTFEHKIEVRGSVMSRTNVQVGSELGGKLTRVMAKEGQKVRKGQALATIDSEDIQRNMDAINTSALPYGVFMFRCFRRPRARRTHGPGEATRGGTGSKVGTGFSSDDLRSS